MAANLKKAVLDLAKPIILPITRKKLSSFYKGEKVLSPAGKGNVLVLAPHVDDETIGLGGTIVQHLEEGSHVTVAFVTDGAGSVSKMDKEELIERRKQEAVEVQNILGFQEIRFLDLPDGKVESNERSRKLFTELLTEVKPVIIYCPTFVDCHQDHVSTGRVLADVLRQLPMSEAAVRLYEINCPIPPQEINKVIDISSSYAKKEQAIDVFKSQAIDFDGFIELSKMKASLVSNSNAAAVETFLEIPASEFPEQFHQVDRNNYPYGQMFKQVNKSVTLLWGIFQKFDEKQRMYQERIAASKEERGE